jgi:hypothetical protein
LLLIVSHPLPLPVPVSFFRVGVGKKLSNWTNLDMRNMFTVRHTFGAFGGDALIICKHWQLENQTSKYDTIRCMQ